MKRLCIFLLLTIAALTSEAEDNACTQSHSIRGPEGEIAFKITLPKGFDTSTSRCPMVILMHGIFSSKDFIPMPSIAMGLAAEGIASIRFDFDGHGRSDGRMQDMTIEKELADAKAVWDYVLTLGYVSRIGLLGHSQGGVIASMMAGMLANEGGGAAPSGVVLIAPGTVIKEACRGGKFFNARFDPHNPPEYIRCWGMMKLGREYLLTTQELDIYGTASTYKGPVLILHGDKDRIVPMWCSEKFLNTFGERATIEVVAGENHMITNRRKTIVALTVGFFKKVLFG
ncbi:MAG: alpha/beta hydrolase [Bacteroidales bacterium]|nr:alpha/beta hydrolase [Bacteroidales bacterium]